MGVYIKDMQMPKRCSVCPLYDKKLRYGCIFTPKDFSGETIIQFVSRYDWCPLEEISAPHGRLIDAEALNYKMYHEAFEKDSELQKWESGCWIRYKMFENCINDAPAVIEEER